MGCGLLQGGQQGALSFGVQTSPHRSLDTLKDTSGLQSLVETCQNHMSYCVAYTPAVSKTPPGKTVAPALFRVMQPVSWTSDDLEHWPKVLSIVCGRARHFHGSG